MWCFLGFRPGFAYMGGLKAAFAYAAPRVAAARGAGGFRSASAGEQTGIYPATPLGGWQLIGRTRTPHSSDPATRPPTLLQPGDRARFTIAGIRTLIDADSRRSFLTTISGPSAVTALPASPGVAMGGAAPRPPLSLRSRQPAGRRTGRDAAGLEITLARPCCAFFARRASPSPGPISARRSTASRSTRGGVVPVQSRAGTHAERGEARHARLRVHRGRHRRLADARFAQHGPRRVASAASAAGRCATATACRSARRRRTRRSVGFAGGAGVRREGARAVRFVLVDEPLRRGRRMRRASPWSICRSACCAARSTTASPTKPRRSSGTRSGTITPNSNRMGFRLAGRRLSAKSKTDLLSHAVLPRHDPGAAERPADRADGRRPDDRRLSEDRRGDPVPTSGSSRRRG